MSQFLNLNGQLIKDNAAEAYKSRAFLYGDGIFETIRIIDGKAVFLSRHFERLSQSLQKLKIQNSFTFSTFKTEVEKCISVNEIKAGGRLRITVYRRAGGFYLPENNQFSYLIEVSSLAKNTYHLNDNGLIVNICDEIELPQNSFSSIKSLNSLPYVMAAIYRKENHLDEVLLVNADGNICEAGSSNIFLSAGNTLLTPSLEQGCIAGIMRNEILHIAKSAGMKVVEAAVKPSEMQIAQEVFLTNSIKGIQWVSGFGKKRYFNTLSRKLLKELQKRAQSEIED